MKKYFLILFSLLAMFNSCQWIDDDLSDCPQQLTLKFARKTACDTQRYFPSDIKNLRVYLFDEDEKLLETVSRDDITLTANYDITLPYRSRGVNTVVAWADQYDEDYSITDSEKATTKLSDMQLKMKAVPDNRHLSVLYHGLSKFERQESDDRGSIIDTVWCDMQQITNRLHIQVFGLPEQQDFDIRLHDDNDAYDFRADIIPGRPEFVTTAPTMKHDKVRRLDTTVMKLTEGGHTRLAIYDYIAEKEIFSINLVDDLLMYRDQFGNPPYNLECDHDFNIVIVMDKDVKFGTWMMISAVVNEWNVVQREEELN